MTALFAVFALQTWTIRAHRWSGCCYLSGCETPDQARRALQARQVLADSFPLLVYQTCKLEGETR